MGNRSSLHNNKYNIVDFDPTFTIEPNFIACKLNQIFSLILPSSALALVDFRDLNLNQYKIHNTCLGCCN